MSINTVSSPAKEAELERIEKEMKAFPYWYHKITLPSGLITPGWAPHCADIYQVPQDLTGKRVLDIGAWDGYWTFEALKRGAKEVVAIDDFSDVTEDSSARLEQRKFLAWATFDWCRQQLGYSEEVCKRYEMSVYDICEEKLGRFDVVFLFGTLYHMRYPLLCLDKVSAICDGELYVESAILDDYSPYRGGFSKGYPNQMVMEFYPNSEYASNHTNWWAPSLLCLSHMVLAAGFQHLRFWKLQDNPTQIAALRGFVAATKKLTDDVLPHEEDFAINETPVAAQPFPSFIEETYSEPRPIDITKQPAEQTIKSQTRKLHIGGRVAHPDWEILDAIPGDVVNHVGNAIDLSRFADNTFSDVYASHVLEHFDYSFELPKVLKEWHRVLQPNGKLYIAVPNLEVLCQLFLLKDHLNLKQRFFVMRMIFGGQTTPYDFHKVGLTEDILADYLKQAGFKKMQRVARFGLFEDTSTMQFGDVDISLNIIAEK